MLLRKMILIINIINSYLIQSVKNLPEQSIDLLKMKYPKGYFKICENSSIMKSLPQIRSILIKLDSPFKPDFEELHFTNGYFNLKSGLFESRNEKHFVRNYINRDYEHSDENKIESLHKIMKQIYPNENDYNTMLFILGSAITGRATKLQKILFLLGDGSAGKSTIMDICQSALTTYFETLPDTAFTISNKGKDKCFSTFHDNESIRLIWTNEPQCSKMDSSLFKKFCEGQIKGELLYRNGTHTFQHHGLPIFTANEMPNIDIDTGVKRRFRAYNHTSLFTDDVKLIDENKNIYLKNDFLLDTIINSDMLNTWIQILVSYASRWLNGEIIPITDNFTKSTEAIIEVNDEMRDFVDSTLRIVKSDNDRKYRIGKNEMLELYKTLYPKSHISTQQLIPKLKSLKIEYDCSIRDSNSIRGCFIGVEVKDLRGDDRDDDEDVINLLYNNKLITKDENIDDIIKSKNIEIEKLKDRIYEMEQLLLNNKKSQMKENKKIMKPSNDYELSDEVIKQQELNIKETIANEKKKNKEFIKQQKEKEEIPVIDLEDIFNNNDILKDIFN